MKAITIHTDGGCQGNPGPGGWAAVLRYGEHVREVTGGEPATTNNRMELQAAIGALTALKEPCEITFYTDSQYVRQGITKWLRQWKVRQWRTLDRKPVKNDDLWRELDAQAARHKITWKWLKGHAGNRDNERCDQLAGEEMAKLRKCYTPSQLSAAREAFSASRDPDQNQAGLL